MDFVFLRHFSNDMVQGAKERLQVAFFIVFWDYRQLKVGVGGEEGDDILAFRMLFDKFMNERDNFVGGGRIIYACIPMCGDACCIAVACERQNFAKQFVGEKLDCYC